MEVDIFDAAAGFDYRSAKIRMPSLHPANVLNSFIAVKRYGRDWRWFYRRTDFAFRWMSRRASQFWLKNENRFDAVLQSGALFNGAPSREKRSVPFLMHLDHTYAISKRAQPVAGVKDSRPASAVWEAMEHATYRDADLIFTMSEFVRQSLIQDYAVAAESVVRVGGGPNLAVLPELTKNQALGPVVLFVGKDFSRKGGPTVMEAFTKVRAKLPEAELLIVGPKDVPAAPGVTSFGLLSHSEMPPLYERSRVFVMPSWREPYGIAFIEAMAYGLPCIGSRIEAIPEIIDESFTGCLVEPGDADGLAATLLKLLCDRDWAGALGAAGRLKVESELNWEHVTETMLSAITEVVHKSRKPSR
ncbi:MAG: glycosyltransferase family 4 protein [Verrucomicrobiales bacterium]|nr:glycosyltransferase family 4 protein [Verrucomicrobiales bacterium]